MWSEGVAPQQKVSNEINIYTVHVNRCNVHMCPIYDFLFEPAFAVAWPPTPPIADFVTIERVHYHNVPFPQLVESENKRKTKANQNKTKIRGRTRNKIPSQFDFSLKASSYICFMLLMLGILTYVSLLCLLEGHCGLGSTGVNTIKLKLNSFSQSSFIMLFSGVLRDAHHFPYLFSLFFSDAFIHPTCQHALLYPLLLLLLSSLWFMRLTSAHTFRVVPAVSGCPQLRAAHMAMATVRGPKNAVNKWLTFNSISILTFLQAPNVHTVG